MQTLRNIQGTKDAGNKWYHLLVKIFQKLGLKVNATCQGVWHWNYDGTTSITCLATDDMLFGTTDPRAFDCLLLEFKKYFEYTTCSGQELSFLNFQIIQSEYGISINQSSHICQNILQKFFPQKDLVIPFSSSLFLLSNDFEMKLFRAPHLSDDELKSLAEKYRGGFSTWSGALLDITEKKPS